MHLKQDSEFCVIQIVNKTNMALFITSGFIHSTLPFGIDSSTRLILPPYIMYSYYINMVHASLFLIY